MMESESNLGNLIHSGFVGLSMRPPKDNGIELTTKGATIQPRAKTDLWRKTYYEPMIIRDNAPFLYHSFQPNNQRWMLETEFELVADSQFDQAGVHLRIDETCWLKAGIEFVDGSPRLSCVVTNEFSDWSTQAWTSQEDGKTCCKLRVHGCANASFIVEAWMRDHWEFIRIAHLDGIAVSDDATIKAGLYAACPVDQKGGCKAVFQCLTVRSGSNFVHSSS